MDLWGRVVAFGWGLPWFSGLLGMGCGFHLPVLVGRGADGMLCPEDTVAFAHCGRGPRPMKGAGRSSPWLPRPGPPTGPVSVDALAASMRSLQALCV